MLTNATASMKQRAACLLALSILGVSACDFALTDPMDGPQIVTRALPSAMVHESYSGGVEAKGGAGGYNWDMLDGDLPAGLDVSLADLDGTGVLIAGTPEDAGEYTFFLVVEDREGMADTAQLSLDVVPGHGAPGILSRELPPALAGASYAVALVAGGGAGEYEWTLVDGTLPPGLSFTAAGRFEGSPSISGHYEFRVQVSSDGMATQTTVALDVLDEQTGFAITEFQVADLAPSLRDNLDAAMARWEAALTGNLPTIAVPVGDGELGEQSCGGFGSLVNGASIDDLLLLVDIDSIDGVGGALGRAGPCAVRSGSLIPAVGYIRLDVADLQHLAARSEELVTDLIQHEIGHVLGFGTMWPYKDLVVGLDGDDPRYTGSQAVAVYQAAGGNSATIPVENDGGEGTADKHWRESTFDKLLMTGYSESSGVDMPLSRMTIASFADLGYQVDLGAADQNADVLSGLALDRTEHSQSTLLGHDAIDLGPIHVLGGERHRSVLPDLRVPQS